ncbi:hypothetical protein HX033_16150 [Myroides odoratimimus]|uniref:hypothetical protein n=2 Tax=Myroides odoratimimus TaxID=76832 RepID=UPI00257869DD|nr:hypothetical protein [Myroides odoratimimus]MDM1402202.1 hypothetical protein [Myroides odoratimimus]
MSWSAEQVYTIANTTVIERLQQIEELRQGLFNIDTLEKGIRSEWTREIFFENEHRERKHIKHSLPQDGLFVINPSMSRTAYDDQANAFYASYAEYKKNKWQFLEHIEIVPMVLSLNLTLEQCKLLAFLQQLNEETKQPFMYYKCEMWGGDIDEEIAVVFDGEMKVYYFDELAGEYKQMIGAEIKELEDTTALQKGLEAIGLVLPTYFFALHETSFDWYPYQVRH